MDQVEARLSDLTQGNRCHVQVGNLGYLNCLIIIKKKIGMYLLGIDLQNLLST